MLKVREENLLSHIFTKLILPVIALALMPIDTVFGQALDLTFDLNTPATKSKPRYNSDEISGVETGLSLSFGYYSRPSFGGALPYRFGLVGGLQKISIGADGSVQEFSAFNLQGRFDYRVYRSKTICLSIGAAFGLLFRSENEPCHALLCDLPGSVVLITPYLRTSVNVGYGISAVIDLKGSVFMTDSDTTYPYKSGAILAIGIEVNAGSM